MIKRIAYRVLQAVPLVFMFSVAAFALLHMAPGGELRPYLRNPHLTAADMLRLESDFGLNKPLYAQYWGWLTRLVHGDLGWSSSNSEPVLLALLDRAPATLLLMSVSFTISILFGGLSGIVAALRPYSTTDRVVSGIASVGQAVPIFWLALILQLLFTSNGLLHLPQDLALPSAGMNTDDQSTDPLDVARHLALPALALSSTSLAAFSAFTRNSLIETLATDYVRTARAKGVSPLGIVVKHALRTTLFPIITLSAPMLPTLLGGSVVLESVFAWPGMGNLFLNALTKLDYPLLMAYLLLNATLIIGFGLLADVAYELLDPRVTYS